MSTHVGVEHTCEYLMRDVALESHDMICSQRVNDRVCCLAIRPE